MGWHVRCTPRPSRRGGRTPPQPTAAQLCTWPGLRGNLLRGNYHAACGWHLTPFTGRIWTQKESESGPPESSRCRSCVATSDRQRFMAWHKRCTVESRPSSVVRAGNACRVPASPIPAQSAGVAPPVHLPGSPMPEQLLALLIAGIGATALCSSRWTFSTSDGGRRPVGACSSALDRSIGGGTRRRCPACANRRTHRPRGQSGSMPPLPVRLALTPSAAETAIGAVRPRSRCSPKRTHKPGDGGGIRGTTRTPTEHESACPSMPRWDQHPGHPATDRPVGWIRLAQACRLLHIGSSRDAGIPRGTGDAAVETHGCTESSTRRPSRLDAARVAGGRRRAGRLQRGRRRWRRRLLGNSVRWPGCGGAGPTGSERTGGGRTYIGIYDPAREAPPVAWWRVIGYTSAWFGRPEPNE